MSDPKKTLVNGRVEGNPCDVEVTSLHGIGEPAKGVTVRLDSKDVPAFWMEVHLARELIAGMYHWLNGTCTDLPEV